MSYDIYIGNGQLKPIDEEDEAIETYTRIIHGKVCHFKMHVEAVRQSASPTFSNDEMTGNSNNRHPGYAQWSTFLEATGMETLFSHPEHGLMRHHPGYTPLEPWHEEAISAALRYYQEMHPQAVPGFGTTMECAHLARLIWLDWWVKWALTNCEHAGIYNW